MDLEPDRGIGFGRRWLLDRGLEIIAIYKSFASLITCKAAPLTAIHVGKLAVPPADPTFETVLRFPPLIRVDDARLVESLKRTPRFRCILETEQP